MCHTSHITLLQGWEDLRLDERLMQVVGNFASMLQSDPSTARRQLLPKPLSITPLGPSMGLIQWVDHTMPLYGMYKAWQQRQAADKAGMHAALSQLASYASCSLWCMACTGGQRHVCCKSSHGAQAQTQP